MNGVIIRRNSFPMYESVKCEVLTNSTSKRSNKFFYPLPQIAIKKTKDGQIIDELQIGLFNGCWDTSEKIPRIVAEMPGTQNSFSDSESEKKEGEDCDQGNKNLSWLLDYKFSDLIPISGRN